MSSLVPWEQSRKTISGAECHLEADLDETWYQGKGVYGGVTAALTLDAMLHLVDDQRSPRSLSVRCFAPVPAGLIRVVAQVDHRGRRVSYHSARVYSREVESTEGHGRLVASATASFGSSRGHDRDLKEIKSFPSAPQPPNVSETPFISGLMPDFCQHLSYRYCLGGAPYSGAEEASLGGWCDMKHPAELSYLLIAALLDAWAPSELTRITRPMRAASIEFNYQFLLGSQELSMLKRPFLYLAEGTSVNEGYLSEDNWLWDCQGRPIASSRQLIALG